MKEKQQGALLQKGQQFPLTIKRLGINGEGVGYFKKQVVFVSGALPGEEVVVEATNVQAKYAEGTVRKVQKALRASSQTAMPSIRTVRRLSASAFGVRAAAK